MPTIFPDSKVRIIVPPLRRLHDPLTSAAAAALLVACLSRGTTAPDDRRRCRRHDRSILAEPQPQRPACSTPIAT